MKFKTIIFSAIGAGLLLTSCGGPGEGRSVEDMTNPTTIDSLSNLLGQLYAADYWSNAGNDSIARSDKARQEYLKGVKEALSKAGKDKSYIEGYMLGLQLSMFADQYEEQLGVKVDMDRLMDGMAYGLRNDSAVNIVNVNQEFQRINTRFQMQQDAINKKAADENLASFIKGKNYIAMGNGLYGKIIRQGNGDFIKKGDIVECDITISDTKGKKIGIPMPKNLSLNDRIAKLPAGQALQKMKSGGAGEFVTTAFDMFGANATEYGLESSQPLVMTIEVLGATAAPEDGKIQGKVTDVKATESAPAKTDEQIAAQKAARARTK